MVDNMTTIDLGDGYFLKASKGQIGSFQIVAIDWQHPNYGYFTDAMLWFNSPHTMSWNPIPIVNWTEKYENIEEFLKEFPELEGVF
jgi:hypothetical protein